MFVASSTCQGEAQHVSRGAGGVQPDAGVRAAHQPRQRGRGRLLQRLGGEHRAHQGPAQLPAARVQIHRRGGRQVFAQSFFVDIINNKLICDRITVEAGCYF